MKVILVKKRLVNGQFCAKCIDVQQKLEDSGNLAFIDEVVIADENNPDSTGMKIAREFNVSHAPFFVVEQEGQPPMIYTVYFKLVKEVLNLKSGLTKQLNELMAADSDEDFS